MTVPSHHRAAFLLGPRSLEIREVPTVLPAAGELLLRIEAATTCGTDLKVFQRGGHPTMLTVPGPFGHEIGGEVVALGPTVDQWSMGDRVTVANSAPCQSCGPCHRGDENLCRSPRYLNGSFAEMILVPERFAQISTRSVPADLPLEEAILAEPLACVIHGLQTLSLPPSQDVLLLGTGPIGLLFLMKLKTLGHRVHVRERDPRRLDTAHSLGAASTTLVGLDNGNERAYDAAIDATGTAAGWDSAIAAVRPGGRILLFGGCPPGSTLSVDATRLHYEEISILGSYHYRAAEYSLALTELARRELPVSALLSAERALEELETALLSMESREALKVVIRP